MGHVVVDDMALPTELSAMPVERVYSSPIYELKFFHTAIRAELDNLHQDAMALEFGADKEIWDLLQKYLFLRRVYRHHSSGEDEVILPALDLRVKNVANTYSLEHKVEGDLFDNMHQLLTSALRESGNTRAELLKRLICCTEALQTTLGQHLAKEEEQVLPLLMEHFSAEEQALLVWQSMCCIPVSLMEECLSWMASFLSEEEREEMVVHMHVIVPDETLLRQVFSTWLTKGEGAMVAVLRGCTDAEEAALSPREVPEATVGLDCPPTPALVKEDHLTTHLQEEVQGQAAIVRFPINELLHWHNAIRKELEEFVEEARRLQHSGLLSAPSLAAFAQRYRFLADVCFFHSAAEEEVVFPAVDKKVKMAGSFTSEHASEERQFLDVGRLLAGAQLKADKGSPTCVHLVGELCSQAEAIAESVLAHLSAEEGLILPAVREHCSVEEQRVIVYQSLRQMPLRLLERVLPWVVAYVTEEEAADMVRNMRLAAPPVDSALVTLFSGWAQKAPAPPCSVEEVKEAGRPSKRMKEASEGGVEEGERREEASSSGRKPIDTIFQFHQALRCELQYLDTECAKLATCDEGAVRQFSGRFQFLWGLYRAHSNAEDNIVFPALEAKEALSNVSHSYTIDHRQEERLFEDIAQVLAQLRNSSKREGEEEGEVCANRVKLGERLQRMCSSVRVSLDHHVCREETELWPLFAEHFTEEEQDRIVGRIIGTTGAEVLQAMLPWITCALTEAEQSAMLDTWRQATRNTMFDQWLRAWWKDSIVYATSMDPPPPPDKDPNPKESLQMVAEYLEGGGVAWRGGKGSEFKPGWQDIFRMNQQELEKALRTISSDQSLDPRRKAYLMQNLMTSKWIVAQQHKTPAAVEEGGPEVAGRCASYHDEGRQVLGCEHYQRKCKLKAACCGELVTCRFCHDKVSDHSMDRHATEEMMCMACLEVQPVAQTCATPACNSASMAKYFCAICKFFEDDDRHIYHCPFCNLCRVGRGLGQDYFHCMTCNACMSMDLATHKCRAKGLETNCPICHDFLFTSATPVKALPCAHFMHSACFQAYTCTHYTCPICIKSLGDMGVYFGMLDALLASEQLPAELRDRQQDILCNDCEKKGKAPFHWLYHKCTLCGSYNTRAI